METSIIPFYKRTPKSYEIACMMFENCNLRCKFCFEPHINKKIDLDYIMTIPNIIKENFSKEYEKHPTIQKVYLMMWGGEVFYDALPDSVFETYYKFVDSVNDIFQKNFPNVNVIFSWLSNGVFTNYERVEKIVNYSNGIINFSYDPVNRFATKKQKETMVNAAKYFSNNRGDKISITLTKDSIKGFIENDKELIEFNNMGYNIDVNYYIANINWKELLPTDDEIFSFYKWALDNRLFNMKVLEKMLSYYTDEKVSHYCDCKYCSQITYGEWSTDCAKCSSILPSKMFYHQFDDIITEDNSNEIKATMGLIKRGCLGCQYYNNCQKFCWIAVVFEGAKMGICPYVQSFKYIDENPKILEDFLRWRDDYKARK